MTSNKPPASYAPATLAIRAGIHRTAEGEHAEPIFPTSSFVFSNAAEAAARFSGDLQGNVYSRFSNPTVSTFEQRLAALEGAESCVATSSGMAAILSVCMALLEKGDHILAARGLFGSTTMLFKNYLSKFGISVDYLPMADLESWRKAFKHNTRMVFIETPTNPLMEIGDIKALADLAHQHNSLLVVDNCFCTPVLQQPLALGADIVVHSATKYLDGQGRCLGGAVLGNADLVGKQVFGFLRSAGPTMSPFNAWVFSKGLETLALRMRAHCEQAGLLANWLTTQPAVSKVHYPGLTSHPDYELAQRQQKGAGGIVSFELSGGQAAAWTVIDQCRLLSITANLGDVKTTITHPATTTHARLNEEERKLAGIAPGLIRISVGLEQIEDLQADLAHGFSLLD